ncbi:epoxyqueuosine reductase [Thermodesulfobacteriota bacterium]
MVKLSQQIVKKALEFGASAAGIANVEALKTSPSHLIFGKLDKYQGVGTINNGRVKAGKVRWPENATSAIVIVVEHPETEPELDWWKDGYAGGTAGNRVLIDISNNLSDWLKSNKGIETDKLPYHIENGGIFLKDAAVLAGLGCIGKNNMLVTPEFGPRVRLRAILTDETLSETGVIDFDPCKDCPEPCRIACPRDAFQKRIYLENEFSLDRLPARTGVYDRHLCNIQMEADVKKSETSGVKNSDSDRWVWFCRICEFACPIGKAL